MLWQEGHHCEPPIRCQVMKEMTGCLSAKDCCNLDNSDWLATQRAKVIRNLQKPHRDKATRIPYETQADPYVESFGYLSRRKLR